jgi:ribulose-phosphate 3-epimerase
VLDKVALVRHAIDARALGVDLQVDGGIDPDTAPLAVAAGANVLVAGSAIFGTEDPAAAAAGIRSAAQSAR